ncbi:MAG: ADP-ribosylglycohydrolase [Clostridia bacterium]|nr:ADP-ribosylglycohydrolase [Clostridia bacterium]
MIGPIIGDMAGSRFERHNHLSKDFDLWHRDATYTDDTVMSLAICNALMQSAPDYSEVGIHAVKTMQEYGRRNLRRGYGGYFLQWLLSPRPQPYGSYGNGGPMRVAGCGWAGSTLDEVKRLSKAVTEVTHNHPEALKGAEAVATTVFLARHGASRDELREWVIRNYYPLDFTLDEIRGTYTFDVSSQGSVPQALEAFFESTDFEDAIRNAVSAGGDSDTIACMAGAVAEAFYGVSQDLREAAEARLSEPLKKVLHDFEQQYPPHTEQ